MKEDQLTPWFPADTPPFRKGKYQYRYVEYQSVTFPVLWNGYIFSLVDSPFEGEIVSVAPGDQWRGLRSKP